MVQRDTCRGEGGGGGGERGDAPTVTASCYIGDLLVDQ